MGRFAGKTALVTGGSRGIGAAVVQRLADEGARVAFTYSSSAEAARAVEDSVEKSGSECLPLQADSACPDACADAVERCRSVFGGPDILVNNAGVLGGGPLDEVSVEEVDRVLGVNLRGAFLFAKAASRYLGEGGRVVNIGSIGSHWFPQPMGALYGMTKAGVHAMTQGLARDLGPRGVTVNTVEPGPIETDMLAEEGPMDVPLLPLVAVGRFGRPQEVAALVAFLCSSEAGFITGARITIDGGISL